MAMSSGIYQALLQSNEQFVPKPQWLVLATIHGEYLGHLVKPDTHIEIDRITLLAAGASGHHERRTMEHDLGAVRYGLTFADKGFVITAFIGDNWVLSLMFKEATLTALMSTLQGLPKVVDNLVQLESLMTVSDDVR
jgi:hypothetical protein